MAYFYKIFKDLNFCYAKASGSINSIDIFLGVQKMFEDKDWNFSLNVINDYRDILELVVNKDDIDKIVELEEKNSRFFNPDKRGKLAFVLTNDIHELIVRLYAAKTKKLNKDVRVFHVIEDALEWISLKEVPPEIFQR